ncbi:protein HID1-like [Amphibalanus amphitrite]|uniref:protein HID1-like n=1 Tax=Amphibalanus amphitrite TaxID=1232801 RepID=UPI001C928849|nr:protein HID1-like [Amphibalanus amphitrite]
MGNADSKASFRQALLQLTSKSQPVDPSDTRFWDQFWSESVASVEDVFAQTPAADIRALREEMPANMATVCFKAVEKLLKASETGCSTQQEQQTVLNCVRVLTRLLPYIFEDSDWSGFFWTSARPAGEPQDGPEPLPLAQTLMVALCDLLFCPDFTVTPSKAGAGVDQHEDVQSIDSCEYIWEAGVGFSSPVTHSSAHDSNRTEILKLLLTCFSQTMYLLPSDGAQAGPNRWVQFFTSAENRHALPLFTSLLNLVCAYDPVGMGLPYNHLLFNDKREALMETALQILIVTLDHDSTASRADDERSPDNLFINYLSRIHREEDFDFILKGFTRLLNNPLTQTYLPHSTKKVHAHQELLVFFWKCCDYNKKLLFFVLKSSDVLQITVPILYHLNECRADQARVGLMHIGVFILLLLSGERNFGVRLNKPYTAAVAMDVPVFSGTHGDLLIIVFHKIITTGHQRLQPLFDCLLTILVNVSPYLKTLSMVSATKLLHLLEAFTTPWFLFSAPNNHHLVFFLLEIFNNIIQYQFDGNSNLVYTIIRKRQVFHNLANLPTDHGTIDKSLSKRSKAEAVRQPSLDGSSRALAGAAAGLAEQGALKATLAATPRIDSMTEKESAHPQPVNIAELSLAEPAGVSRPQEGSTSDAGHEETGGAAAAAGQAGPSTSSPGPSSPTPTTSSAATSSGTGRSAPPERWVPTSQWVSSWKNKLPLQTIMRLLQVLVPQVEKICIDKGLTDESEILKFLQHGTLVGLLPVPHPILIRKYQANSGTTLWFRTYMWGVIYLRNVEPPIWFDTDVKLFEIQRM